MYEECLFWHIQHFVYSVKGNVIIKLENIEGWLLKIIYNFEQGQAYWNFSTFHIEYVNEKENKNALNSNRIMILKLGKKIIFKI